MRSVGRKRKTGPRSGTGASSFRSGRLYFGFCAVAVRLFDVMVLGAIERYSRPVLSAEVDIVPHSRADILDRSGLLLATNLPTVNLYADAQKVIDAEDAARRLIRVLPHLSYKGVLNRLTSGRRFVYLARSLTPAQQHAVNVQGIPGISFEDTERRVYLQGPLLSHVLGATDPDNRGISGLELAFHDALSDHPEIPLRLTVDAKIQHTVRTILRKNMKIFKAVAASAVVMDVKTGDILSLVSLPDYQPESFWECECCGSF